MNRRSFISALAAFVFGVQAEVLRASKILPGYLHISESAYLDCGVPVYRYKFTEGGKPFGFEIESDYGQEELTRVLAAQKIRIGREDCTIVFTNNCA